jgi:hypothetical protein
MVLLIILNIILIVLILFLLLYFTKNNKYNIKDVCVNNDKSSETKIYKSDKDKQKTELKSERVFVGRVVSEEEYQQMKKNKKSDISNLMEDINREYEHLKELNK